VVRGGRLSFRRDAPPDLWAQSAALRAGEVSSVELVEACQTAIARHDDAVAAFIARADERALEAARALDDERARTGPRGPLHGIPIAVKDNIDVAGFPTTAGSALRGDEPAASEDAPLVAGLRAAGAVFVGKTNLDEFAYGFTTQNPHFGATANPWDRSRVAGGSSGGSAVALALGMCSAAVGTDTNGSVRVPASLCGLVGLRPSYGRVSLRGIVPLAASYEQAGPLAHSARDAALLLQAMAGYDPGHPTSRDVEVPDYAAAMAGFDGPFTIGVARSFFAEADAAVLDCVETALARLSEAAGAQLRVSTVELVTARAGRGAAGDITSIESADAVPDDALDDPRLGTVARERLSTRVSVSPESLRRARETAVEVRTELLGALAGVDALATPTCPILAPRPEEADRPSRVPGRNIGRYLGEYTATFGLAGLPSLSVPCGVSSEGLPVGLQLVGRPFEEAALLALAQAIEDALGIVNLRSPLTVA